MKKKGLIIATIVMVLVLAVSLTTATYAWFSVASVTKIENFSVSVISDNSVNIGFKADSTIASYGITSDSFKTGSVAWATPTNGQLVGTWTGENGLSATVDHNILWGAQKKSVAACTNSTSATSTTASDYTHIGVAKQAGSFVQINSANGNSTTLTTPTAAIANVSLGTGTANADESGDFVYIVLGAQPTKTLSRNDLVIMVDMDASTTSSIIGVMAGLHVAYRTCIAANKATSSAQATISDWIEIDLMGALHQADPKTSLGAKQTTYTLTGGVYTYANSAVANDATVRTAYGKTYGNGSVDASYPTNSCIYVISDVLSKTSDCIDQIELVIYLDGADSDCVDSGTGSSGEIKIFFDTAVSA